LTETFELLAHRNPELFIVTTKLRASVFDQLQVCGDELLGPVNDAVFLAIVSVIISTSNSKLEIKLKEYYDPYNYDILFIHFDNIKHV